MSVPLRTVLEASANTPERVDLRSIGLVAFLLLVCIMNYMDRYLIGAFGPQIVGELGLDHTQFGIITGVVFTALYSITALASGLLADRLNRSWVMAAGLFIWSGATALTGFARGFLSLIPARLLVATGESSLVPTATAMLSSRFPATSRATAIGIFLAGIPLGTGGSYLIASTLGPLIGWRNCFFLLGAMGVVLTGFVLLIKDVRAKSVDDQGKPKASISVRHTLRECADLFRTNYIVRMSMLGMIVMTAHLSSLPFIQLWLVNERGFSAESAGKLFGSVLIICGTFGSVLGGTLADWFLRRFGISQERFLVCFVGILAPFIIAFRLVSPDDALFKMGMAASVLFFSGFYGPAFAVMYREIPDHLKSTLTGITVLTQQIFVIGLGTVAIGMASDFMHGLNMIETLTGPILVADVLGLSTLLFYYAIDRRTRIKARRAEC